MNRRRDIFGLGLLDVIPGDAAPPTPPPAPGFVASTPEYQAVYDEFMVTPSDADAMAQDAFALVGVTDGWWAILDRLFIYACPSVAPDSLIDWIHPGVNIATAVNVPVFTAFQGYISTGTEYINTNYTPSIDGVNWVGPPDAYASLGCYLRTQNIAGTWYDIGSRDGGDSQMSAYLTGNFVAQLMSSTSASSANITTQGMFSVDGVKNFANITTLEYKNGVWKNSSIASISDTTGDIFSLARSNGGSPANISLRQQSMAWMGGDLGAANQLSLYNAFQALMTHYGTQV